MNVFVFNQDKDNEVADAYLSHNDAFCRWKKYNEEKHLL